MEPINGEFAPELLPPFWLHSTHGFEVSTLRSHPSIRYSTATLAQAFASDPSYGSTEPAEGLPCFIVGRQLCVGTAQDPIAVVSLFLAEISCALLPVGHELAAFAIFIGPQGNSLKSNFVDRPDTLQGEAWFAVASGTDAHWSILQAFSNAGVLRADLETAYLPPAPTSCVIGEGASASVHFMHSARDGQSVAVKKLHSGIDLETVEREVATLLDVQGHENVINFQGLFWGFEAAQLRLSMVFEIAMSGDLLKKVLSQGCMTEDGSRHLFTGLMAGLSHIHRHEIVHRDIKAENILLKSENTVMVADFGLATKVTDPVQMARRCGSPGYVAPEVCIGAAYDYKVDIFGAGVVLHFMLSQEMPFSSPDRDTAATMRKTVKCNLKLHRPPWDAMTSHLRNYLRQLMCKEQAERLDAQQALTHTWIRKKTGKSRSTNAESGCQPTADQPLAPPRAPPAPAISGDIAPPCHSYTGAGYPDSGANPPGDVPMAPGFDGSTGAIG